MKITRNNSNQLEVEKLPDGSTVIFDSVTKTVYSLNETAAAAWVACGTHGSLPEIVDAMRRSLHSTVTEEIAVESLYQLQEQGLVAIETCASGVTRRSLAATAAGVMAPLVLALTSTEQRAFAQFAGSGTTTTTTTTKAPTTTTTTTTTTSTTTTSTTTTSTTTTRPLVTIRPSK